MSEKTDLKEIILTHITDLYSRIFARKIFYIFNRMLFTLSLRGIGILNYKGPKNSGELYFINKLLSFYGKDRFVVFDIGANQGNYVQMILKSKNDSIVYAFEPHCKTFAHLKEHIGKKENVHLNNAGCGSVNGEMTLYDLKKSDGSELATLYKEVITSLHKEECVESRVNIIRLDDFCKDNGINNINLLKIDTEGSELEVLKGAEELLGKGAIDVIHFEFNMMNVSSRVFLKDFYELLGGYVFFRLLPDGMINMGKYDAVFFEIFAFQNIVAIRRDILKKIKL